MTIQFQIDVVDNDTIDVSIRDSDSGYILKTDNKKGIVESDLTPAEHSVLAKFREATPSLYTEGPENIDEIWNEGLYTNVSLDEDGSEKYPVPGLGVVQFDYYSATALDDPIDSDVEWKNIRLYIEGAGKPDNFVHMKEVREGEFTDLAARQSHSPGGILLDPVQEQAAAKKSAAVER